MKRAHYTDICQVLPPLLLRRLCRIRMQRMRPQTFHTNFQQPLRNRVCQKGGHRHRQRSGYRKHRDLSERSGD